MRGATSCSWIQQGEFIKARLHYVLACCTVYWYTSTRVRYMIITFLIYIKTEGDFVLSGGVSSPIGNVKTDVSSCNVKSIINYLLRPC